MMTTKTMSKKVPAKKTMSKKVPAKKIARIFEEVTSMFHFCDEGLDYLDARGRGYESKAAALRAAASAGYTHAIGSGCPWEGVKAIPARYTDKGGR